MRGLQISWMYCTTNTRGKANHKLKHQVDNNSSIAVLCGKNHHPCSTLQTKKYHSESVCLNLFLLTNTDSMRLEGLQHATDEL